MVYLNNNTELQEVWIPKNDGTGSSHKPTKDLEGVDVKISQDITVVHPSSGYYGMSAVTIDATEYGQQNYDSGFDDGYIDGYASGSTDERDKLSAVTFTANTQVSLDDGGYSAVTVNVPQTGHTDQELEDAYDSGYTSGETHQKSLLASTAFTQNGQYTRENGWSGITVNIDTASTYNSGYTSGYTSGYSSGYTSGYTSGSTDGYDSGYTSGYSSGYSSGHTSGVTEGENNIISTFSSTTATTNGQYGSTAHPLSSITVNVPQTGSTAVLGVGSFSANGTYSASTDNLDGYSAITINVQTGTKEIVMCVSGGCWFNTNYLMEYGDQIEFEHCTFGKYGAASASRHQQYVGGGSGEFFRIGTSDNELYLKYFYYSIPVYSHLPSDHSLIEDETVLFNSTGFTIGGNVITAYTAGSESRKANIIFFANTESGADSVQNQTAKMGRVKVYSYDGTLKATFEPRLDEFNVPYFKYIEEDIDIYASGNTAPFYEEIIINEDYQSGYTDGQNSIISTFTATTATTNGVYGSSANPLSSITVNVPQTGSTGTTSIFFADYIHTEVLEDNEKYGRIDTGIYQTVDTVFRVKGMAKGYAACNELVGFDLNDSGEYSDYRLFAYSTSGETLGYDWYSERLETSNWGGLYDGREIDFTCSNYQVYDNINETVILSGNAQTNVNQSIPIYANPTNWWLKSLEIWQGNTKVFDGVAAYDENGNIGLYDSVSRELKYNSGVAMEYEIISPSDYYDSGYTDGYSSGYTSGYTSGTTDGFNSGYTSGVTDGENNIISTFSSTTATTNGIYGSSANPLSSITVNVNELSVDAVASRNYTFVNPTITVNQVKQYAFGNTEISAAYDSNLSGMLTFVNSATVYTFAFYGTPITGITWPQSELIYLNGDSIFSLTNLTGELVIPSNVHFANAVTGVFERCYNITSVVFHGSTDQTINRVPATCFRECTSLSSVTFYDVLNIYGSAFYGCSALTQIYSHNVTAPSISNITGISQNGTVHYPSGSDYSSWRQLSCFSNWNFVGDL